MYDYDNKIWLCVLHTIFTLPVEINTEGNHQHIRSKFRWMDTTQGHLLIQNTVYEE